jgi:tetratricopeptide (TPR) repeat protein
MAQRDSSVFDGTPWESVEQERDAIESAILSGNAADALVVSTSNLYLHRNSPSFDSIATSVFRAYAGLSPDEAERQLEFAVSELDGEENGLGWLAAGLLARAAMKEASAAEAFRCAASDEMCCRIPQTNILLFESLIPLGQIEEATAAYEAAVKSASTDPTVLFQVRQKFAEAMREQGRTAFWQETARSCSESEDPLESAWGNQQQALYAWYQGDREAFAEALGKATVARSALDASAESEWRWVSDRRKWTDRHLGYATAALEGSTAAQLALDVECSTLAAQERDLKKALTFLEPWLPRFPIGKVDEWDDPTKLWGQRLHLYYNILLGRLGRYDEAVAGFRRMIPYARNTSHVKFEPHIYCHLGYALKIAGRYKEALEAYETGLSLLDVPDRVVDPSVVYYREGRIGKNARMGFVANYRHLVETVRRMEEER